MPLVLQKDGTRSNKFKLNRQKVWFEANRQFVPQTPNSFKLSSRDANRRRQELAELGDQHADQREDESVNRKERQKEVKEVVRESGEAQVLVFPEWS